MYIDQWDYKVIYLEYFIIINNLFIYICGELISFKSGCQLYIETINKKIYIYNISSVIQFIFYILINNDRNICFEIS